MSNFKYPKVKPFGFTKTSWWEQFSEGVAGGLYRQDKEGDEFVPVNKHGYMYPPSGGSGRSTGPRTRRRIDYDRGGDHDTVANGIEDPQYVETIYKNKTKFGRKETKTLSKLYAEREKDAVNLSYQYQSYRLGGFNVGCGPYRLGTIVDTLTPLTVYLPVFCFRLNVPGGFQVKNQAGVLLNNTQPLVAYQLTRTKQAGGSTPSYAWSSATTGAPDVAGVYTENNISSGVVGVKYNRLYPATSAGVGNSAYNLPTGVNLGITKYQHNYTDIGMTFYSRSSLPGEVETSIVRFDERFGPGSAAVGQTAALVNTVYLPFVDAPNPEDVQAMDNAWDQFLMAKITHPLAKVGQVSTNRTFNLPFKPVKRETFIVPSSATTAGGVRMMKKIFHRADKYHTCMDSVFSAANARPVTSIGALFGQDLAANYVPGGEDARVVNPGIFPEDNRQEWLMVTCNDYIVNNAVGYANFGTSNEFPNIDISFDIFIKNRFTVYQIPQAKPDNF